MTVTVTPNEFVEHISSSRDYRQQIVHLEHIPARPTRYAKPRRPLPAALQQVLNKLGAGKLYVHQTQAINATRCGHHVIVVTSTASSKTRGYTSSMAKAVAPLIIYHPHEPGHAAHGHPPQSFALGKVLGQSEVCCHRRGPRLPRYL